MTSPDRQDAPRYATLRDYVRVVRRYRLLIAVIMLACGAAAFALTAREKKTYAASASVFFQDTTQQELNLLGTAVAPTLSDLARAQLNQHLVTSGAVVTAATHKLAKPVPGSSVTTAISSQTNEVIIQATAPQAAGAAQVANAYAQATKSVAASQTRAQLSTVVNTVKSQYAPLIKGAPDAATRAIYTQRIATLEVLAKTADPVEIIQPATTPGAPTGPRTVRNTILGVLLGLTLALLAAFGRDALDRRLRGAGEISEQFDWPVLGHVRERVFGMPVFVSRNGKPVADERDREAFRMLRQNVRFLDVDEPPKTIAVTSALPEEGKSTVAAGLACASAMAGVRTLLIDCDLRRPSLAERFGLQKAPGVTDYLLGEATPAEVLQIVELPPSPAIKKSSTNGHGPDGEHEKSQPRRLACIAAGSIVPETAALLGSERFKHFLHEVSAAYDQVVLDSSPLLSVADTAVLLPEAAATLICVRAGKTTHEVTDALKSAIDRLPHRLMGVVVTGVKPGRDDDLGYYAYAYDSVA